MQIKTKQIKVQRIFFYTVTITTFKYSLFFESLDIQSADLFNLLFYKVAMLWIIEHLKILRQKHNMTIFRYTFRDLGIPCKFNSRVLKFTHKSGSDLSGCLNMLNNLNDLSVRGKILNYSKIFFRFPSLTCYISDVFRFRYSKIHWEESLQRNYKICCSVILRNYRKMSFNE